MLAILTTNELLRDTISTVQFHWRGVKTDKAMIMLAKCEKLAKLNIVISRSTTNELSARENEFMTWFGPRKPSTLADALGMDELLQLRNLEDVNVLHVSKRVTARRTDEERCSLELMLRNKLLKRQPSEAPLT